jgi:hypothetical protein
MFTLAADILLAVFVVFIVVALILIASVRLFLSILDYNRSVPPHTLRRMPLPSLHAVAGHLLVHVQSDVIHSAAPPTYAFKLTRH